MSGLLTGFSHPLVDRVEGEYACMESRADRVVLTEGLADALVATTAAGLTPVLITRTIARLSYLARYHLTTAGGRWLIRDGSLLRDPLSSLVADSVAGGTRACKGGTSSIMPGSIHSPVMCRQRR